MKLSFYACEFMPSPCEISEANNIQNQCLFAVRGQIILNLDQKYQQKELLAEKL